MDANTASQEDSNKNCEDVKLEGERVGEEVILTARSITTEELVALETKEALKFTREYR